MNTSTLSQEEKSQFQEFNDCFIPKRKKQFQTYAITNKKPKHEEAATVVLEKSFNVLKENGILDIDKTKFYIEFHKRNSGFEKKNFGEWFDWHKDDYAAVPWKGYSVIYYLRKDNTLKGGDLEYKLDKTRHIHNIKAGDILQFKGNISHRPQATTGFGCRDIIVVFIKRTK